MLKTTLPSHYAHRHSTIRLAIIIIIFKKKKKTNGVVTVPHQHSKIMMKKIYIISNTTHFKNHTYVVLVV